MAIPGCRRAASPGAPAPAAPGELERRIADDERKLAEHPTLWSVRARLARAYLEQARATGDPSWLGKAETQLDASAALQPNVPAWIGRAALASYRHRWDEALTWIDRAAEVAPEDREVRVLAVEAFLELNRPAQAERFLPERRDAEHFLDAAALARWHRHRGDHAAAVHAFETAVWLAPTTGQKVWALVRAAGVYLDTGRPAEARPFLDRAGELLPHDRELRVHHSEWLEAGGRVQEALAVIEDLLVERAAPELHERAARLAQRVGRADAARRHREAARRGYERESAVGRVDHRAALARLDSAPAP